jgi:hypothetical protein
MEERKASSSGTAEMRVGVEAEVVMLNRWQCQEIWREAGIYGKKKVGAAVSKAYTVRKIPPRVRTPLLSLIFADSCAGHSSALSGSRGPKTPTSTSLFGEGAVIPYRCQYFPAILIQARQAREVYFVAKKSITRARLLHTTYVSSLPLLRCRANRHLMARLWQCDLVQHRLRAEEIAQELGCGSTRTLTHHPRSISLCLPTVCRSMTARSPLSPMHGHDFAILQQSSTQYKVGGLNLKLDNPPRRDVALLPMNGFLVIAFKADNPGSWLMHCHIVWHASGGAGAADFGKSVEDQAQS